MRPLDVRGTTVRYGAATAVDDVSFCVDAGRVVGLLGPNGCGKSSTLRALLGLVPLAGGSIRVNGLPHGSLEARAQVAYVPDEPDGLGELCVEELFALVRALYRADRGFDQRAARLARAFGLDSRLRVRLDALSHGQRRIAAAVAAFALARPLVVVDEATAALDPEASAVLREALRALARNGAGVLVATQELAFAERVCHDVVLLSAGRVVASGCTATVRGGRPLESAYLAAVGASARMERARRDLDAL